MKLILAVLALAVFVQEGTSQNIDAQWKQTVQNCLQQFGIDEASFKNNNIPDSKKCFFKCLKENSGILTPDGKLDIQAFKAKHPNAPARIITALESCVPQSQRSEICDTAKALHDCMRPKMMKQPK